jgi:hypothetical protein
MPTIADRTLLEASGGAALQLERFSWTDGTLEVSGHWSGVRGQRFMRPTLTAHGPDGRRRMLAVLDHKPWSPNGGAPWLAVFPCPEPPAPTATFDLAVGAGLSIALPTPQAPGAAAPEAATPEGATAAVRFAREERAVEPADPRDAELRRLQGERDAAATALQAAQAQVKALTRGRDEAVAARTLLEQERDALAGELERLRNTGDRHTSERDEAVTARLEAERARESTLAERDAAVAAAEAMRRERDSAVARMDLLRSERDGAATRAEAIRAERQELRMALDAATGERNRLVRQRDEARERREEEERERRTAERERDAAERKLEKTLGDRRELRALATAGARHPTPAAVVATRPETEDEPEEGLPPLPPPRRARQPGDAAAWAARLAALAALLVALIVVVLVVL